MLLVLGTHLLALILLAHLQTPAQALFLSRSHIYNGHLYPHRVRSFGTPFGLLDDSSPSRSLDASSTYHVPPRPAKAKAHNEDAQHDALDPIGLLSQSTPPTETEKQDKSTLKIPDAIGTTKHVDEQTSGGSTNTHASPNAAGSTSTLLPTSASSVSSPTATFADSALTSAPTVGGFGYLPSAASTVTPTSAPAYGSVPSSGSASLGMSNWKIIGIGVLVVGGIAISIAGFTFFDCWWAFISRSCGRYGRRRRRRDCLEEFVPDWKRQTWKMAGDDSEQKDWYTKPPPMPAPFQQLEVPEKAIGMGKEKMDTDIGDALGLAPPRPPFAMRRSPDSNTTLVNSQSNVNAATSLRSEPSPTNKEPFKVKRVSIPYMPKSDPYRSPPVSPLTEGSVFSSPIERKNSKGKKKFRQSASAPNFRQSRIFLVPPEEIDAYGGVENSPT